MTNVIDPYDALEESMPAIQKAIELDPLSSDAWLVHGAINFYLKWDFEKARKSYEKSMELNSWGEAPIYQCICAYTEFLITTGDFIAVNNLFENINRIDPAFFQKYDYKSLVHILNNEPEMALKTFEERLPYSEPNDWYLFGSYGVVLYMTGNYDKALENFLKAIELKEERDWYTLSFLGMSYIHMGMEHEAYEILEELLDQDKEGTIGLKTYIAMLYNEMGDEEKIFNYLDKAYKAHEPILLWNLPIHFRNLKGNARYQALMQDIGFEV